MAHGVPAGAESADQFETTADYPGVAEWACRREKPEALGQDRPEGELRAADHRVASAELN